MEYNSTDIEKNIKSFLILRKNLIKYFINIDNTYGITDFDFDYTKCKDEIKEGVSTFPSMVSYIDEDMIAANDIDINNIPGVNVDTSNRYVIKYNTKDYPGITSEQENKMLNCKPKNVDFIKYWYTLGHDGYDCYGPESDLHDLTVLIYCKKTDKYYLDNWHTEEWFHGSPSQFILSDRKLINNVNDYLTSRI